MKARTYTTIAATLLAALFVLTPASAEPKSKNKILVDFTKQEIDRTGMDVTVLKKYEYAWNAWQNKITFVEKQGILIPFLPSEGVLGSNERLKFGSAKEAEIALVIGNRNEAEAMSFTLTDSDGSEWTWTLPLQGKPRGAQLAYKISLEKADNVDKEGKKPGLDIAKLKQWQFKGNWTKQRIEVLLIQIAAVNPPPAS